MVSSSQIIAIVSAIAAPSAALQMGMRADNHLNSNVSLHSGSLPIKTEYDSSKCLDFFFHDGSKVGMYECNEGSNQQWYFDGVALKTEYDSEKCLDVDTSNNNVNLWWCNGGSNQQWYFENGALKSQYNSNMCMDFDFHGGSNVIMYECHEGTNQNWYFDEPCTDCTGRSAASTEPDTKNADGLSRAGMSFCYRENEELDEDKTACEKYWCQVVGSPDKFPCVYVESAHRCQRGEVFGEHKCCEGTASM